MEDKYNYKSGQHRLVIENRQHTDINGVLHVDSFDDQEIILETEQGLLAVRGEDLHIKQLNLEQGELLIEGLIALTLTTPGSSLRRVEVSMGRSTRWRSSTGRAPAL